MVEDMEYRPRVMETPPAPSLTRRFVVTLLVAVVAVAGGMLLLRKLEELKRPPQKAAGAHPLPLVRTVTLVSEDYRERIRGYGVARSLHKARVCAQVGGVIRGVAPELEAGSGVRPPEGELDGTGPEALDSHPLIRIDRQDLDDTLARLRAERRQALAERARTEADIENFEAQLEVAARRLTTARTERDRVLRLVPHTLPPSDADRQRLAVFALEQIEAELVSRRDTAKASIDVIDARLDVIGASEQRALRDIGRTHVFAPFPGRVTARHVELGDLVAPGAPLFDLVDPERVEVAIALPASRYGQVRPEGVHPPSQAVLRLREGGPSVCSETVARIDPQIDEASLTFRVYVVVPNEDGAIPIAPGAHVVADVDGALYPAVLPVPREAFLEGCVYVAGPGEDEQTWVAHERHPNVRTVLGEIVLVTPGDGDGDLRGGDRVVVTNLEDIADGSRIRVLEASDED